MQVALERDDRVGVRAGRGERRVALAAHELVHAVEGGERGDFHQASLGRGNEASQGRGGGVSMESRHVHENDGTFVRHPTQCGYPHFAVRVACV